MCAYMYMHTNMYTRRHTCIGIHAYACVAVCMCVFMCTHAHVYVCVFVHVCVHLSGVVLERDEAGR